MRLYQWSSTEQKFLPGVFTDPVATGERVILMSLEMTKGEQVRGGPASQEQMICLLKGAWRIEVAGRKLIVRRNEAVIIPRGFRHSAEAIQDSFALQVMPEPKPIWSDLQ